LMMQMAPEGPVYQAGTLSGNPLAMAAGTATLDALRGDEGAYPRLDAHASRLAAGLEEGARASRGPLSVTRPPSSATPRFLVAPPTDYEGARRADTAAFARFHRAMLDRGVHLPPSQFEAWFVSLAHTEADIDRTVAAAAEALRAE